MPISLEEARKLPQEKVHEEYARKLREIGENLGFSVQGLKTPLGLLDCVWRLNVPIPKISRELPVVAFEVVCSEDQKALKGSMLNLLASSPSLAIFVLVREEIKKHPRAHTEPDKWLKRIERFVNKLRNSYSGALRTVIWNENDVDDLYDQVKKKEV